MSGTHRTDRAFVLALGLGLALGTACRVERTHAPVVDASGFDAAAPPPPSYPIEIDGARRLIAPAHGRAELVERRIRLGAALPVLSPEERARVLRRMDVIAAVSVAEGAFDGVATHRGDPMASVGIFQWAGERAQPISEGSSLQRLLVELAARAGCDHCAARDAWQAISAAGVSIDGRAVRLDHAPATGAALERALQPVLSNPAVEAYQLVAAVDWIERIAALPIAPPAAGAAPTTVGALLRSDRALATAVLLGVNRPAWVVPALAEALGKAGADEDRLVDALRAAALRRYGAAERPARAARLLTSEALRQP